MYYLDRRHKRSAYTNLRIAFSATKTPPELKRILKKSFINFAQNIVEILRLSKINESYFNKYVKVEGKNNITEAFKQGRGVVLIGTHFGNWEFPNLMISLMGFDYYIYAKEQKRLTKLYLYLNKLRSGVGSNIMDKGNPVLQIARALKNNKLVGMVADHGGKGGEFIPFFGKLAATPTGAMRFALKFDSPVTIGYIHRIKGPYHAIKFLSFEVSRTADLEKDIKDNLIRINNVIEDYVRMYPEDNLWYYKRWKNSPQKNILILSDGKAGHLNQSKAILSVLSNDNPNVKGTIVEVKYKNKFTKHLLTSCALFCSRHCMGCLKCLGFCLEESTFKYLISQQADIIISAGSTLAPVSLFLKKEMAAISICLMNPGILNKKAFDLIISPKHDELAEAKNIVITEGAPNLINDNYLAEQKQLFRDCLFADNKSELNKIVIGVLFGGDTKKLFLTSDNLNKVLKQVRLAAVDFEADLLVSTSRRTSSEQEGLIKASLENTARLLIIANIKNYASAIGGILAYSDIVIVSGESISMVSEAATSGKYTVVFRLTSRKVDRKHNLFLSNLSKEGFIYLVEPLEIYSTIKNIIQTRPPIKKLNDCAAIREALTKML